jgi:metallo-beta-lactamase family protein
MAKITFWGATECVTGSRFILDFDEKSYLIDCGMFQGSKKNRLRNWEPFPVPPSSISKVFLTHAHIDHSGFLPKFCTTGFTGKIHCTHATRDLCKILLHDTAHLQEEDAEWANRKGFSKHKPALPLFRVEDAIKTMKAFRPYHYGENFYISEDVRVKFRDAGHILGSSFIDIKRTKGHHGRKILFSGDFGRPDRPVLREPDQVYNVDYLVLESTYGDRLHEDISPYEDLIRIINESVERGGVLVIPAFSVGRTQSLLYALRELEEENRIPVLDVFMDSPMAIAATEVFRRRINDLNLTARKQYIQGTKVFHPRKLHICQTVDESRLINKTKRNAIIISASGMAVGGRILHHLIERLPEPSNTLLMIGYQAQGTRGRRILEGESSIKIHGKQIPVRARVASISGFSGHGDYNEILAWLMAFNREPKRTFLVHGEPEANQAMAERIKEYLGWDLVVPKFGESFELDF